MKKWYKIGQVAKMFNMTKHALHFYDRNKIVSPQKIDEKNRFRFYSINDILQISMLKNFQWHGFSIKDAKIQMEKLKSAEEIAPYLDEKLNEIETQMEELKKQRDSIVRFKNNIDNFLKYPCGEVHIETVSKSIIKSYTCSEEPTLEELIEKRIGSYLEKEFINSGVDAPMASVIHCNSSITEGKFHYKEIRRESVRRDISHEYKQSGTFLSIRFSAPFTRERSSYYCKLLDYIEENNYRSISDFNEYFYGWYFDEELNDCVFHIRVDIQVEKTGMH
ncbi:MAG: MerR family transcriptional regulator [Bacilli bacterium]